MNKEILKLRKKMDKIDKKLLRILEKRFSISQKIGKIKKAEGLKIRDIKRENEIIKSRSEKGKLDKKFVKKMFGLVFEESRRLQ